MPAYRLHVVKTVEVFAEVVVHADSPAAAVKKWMQRIRKAPGRDQYGLKWTQPLSGNPSFRVSHYRGPQNPVPVMVPETWIIDAYRSKPKG